MNGWTKNYIGAMQKIVDCQKGGTYGTEEYKGTFAALFKQVMDEADTTNIVFHPGIWYGGMWVANVIYFVSPHVIWWSLFFLCYCMFYICWIFPCCCYGWTFFWISFIFTCGWCCFGFFGIGFLCCWLVYLVFWIFGAVFGWVWYWCAWYLLSVVCFGLPQLLLAMNYAAFWMEIGGKLGGDKGGMSGSPAAAAADAAEDAVDGE